MEASNVDLDRFGRRLFRHFRGAVSKDKLPPPRKLRDGVYAINMQSSHQHTWEGATGGTHWVGLYVNGRRYYYFDSFGMPPPEEVLHAVAGKRGTYNHVRVQPFKSLMCGYYVLYVMLTLVRQPDDMRLDRRGLPQDLRFTRPAANDRIIHQFYESLVRRFGATE